MGTAESITENLEKHWKTPPTFVLLQGRCLLVGLGDTHSGGGWWVADRRNSFVFSVFSCFVFLFLLFLLFPTPTPQPKRCKHCHDRHLLQWQTKQTRIAQ